MAQFFPRNFEQFRNWYPSEETCAKYLARYRWPGGFICPSCSGKGRAFFFPKRLLWQCKVCGRQTSVTASTILHRTRVPLSRWVRAAYLVGAVSAFRWRGWGRERYLGSSVAAFQRTVGIRSYATAWQMRQRIYIATRPLAESDVNAKPRIITEVVLCLLSHRDKIVVETR